MRLEDRNVGRFLGEKRRWGLVFLVGLTVFLMVWGVKHYLAGDAVQRLLVQIPAGTSRVSAAYVTQAAKPCLGAGWLAVNLDCVRRQVVNLPWIRSAHVYRVWPDAIGIAVRVEDPVARWGNHGLVDTAGHVFFPAQSQVASTRLPRLVGSLRSVNPLIRTLEKISKALASTSFHVARLKRDARGALSFTLQDGTRVVLGRQDPMVNLERFTKIVIPALGKRLDQARTVDMRYSNGFAVSYGKSAQASQGKR